jgi:hypothetical protein
MSEKIKDPEVQMLALLAGALEADYAIKGEDPWEGSPFQWIKSQPSRRVGKIGEQLVSGWCATKGFDVVRSGDSDADRVIEGHRIEIKFSTMWQSGEYKFQQIRDQEYDFCFFIGVSPFDAHAWLIPKAVLLEHVIGHMGQHTGAEGSDTAWLGFAPGGEYEWMKPYGGRLADVYTILSAAGRGRHS